MVGFVAPRDRLQFFVINSHVLSLVSSCVLNASNSDAFAGFVSYD